MLSQPDVSQNTEAAAIKKKKDNMITKRYSTQATKKMNQIRRGFSLLRPALCYALV